MQVAPNQFVCNGPYHAAISWSLLVHCWLQICNNPNGHIIWTFEHIPNHYKRIATLGTVSIVHVTDLLKKIKKERKEKGKKRKKIFRSRPIRSKWHLNKNWFFLTIFVFQNNQNWHYNSIFFLFWKTKIVTIFFLYKERKEKKYLDQGLLDLSYI